MLFTLQYLYEGNPLVDSFHRDTLMQSFDVFLFVIWSCWGVIRSCWGVYWFHSVRPSVRLSVRLSVCPSVRLSRLPCPLCNIYSSGWILSILATNDHYHERVCRTQWPFFLYLAQMITMIRRCVACYVFFRIWKCMSQLLSEQCIDAANVLYFLLTVGGKQIANFWNFSALTLKKKIYSSRWILSIFDTNDH